MGSGCNCWSSREIASLFRLLQGSNNPECSKSLLQLQHPRLLQVALDSPGGEEAVAVLD